MKPVLLDVNVLVALFDPMHVHHEVAHQWFAKRGKRRWATCALTVNGAFRVICTLAAMGSSLPLAELGQSFRESLNLPGRVDFAGMPEITDKALFDLTKLSGPKQFTDVLLLAIARQNDGRLLTLDRSIPWRAVKGARAEDVEVIEDVRAL